VTVSRRTQRYAQNVARPLSKVVAHPSVQRSARHVEHYLSLLSGRGAGAGWAFETEVLAAARSIFRTKPVLLDIGANVGKWSIALQQRFPDASIFLFEPVPEGQRAIQEQHLPGWTLIPKVVGSTVGQSSFYTAAAHPLDGSASMYHRRDGSFVHASYDESSIEMTTIDAELEEHGIEFVDFAKMDIEGGEIDALRGAQRALAQGRIGSLSFEFGSGNLNSRTFFLDFWTLLSPTFDLWCLTPGGDALPVPSYDEDLEYFRGVTNYVAILKEHPYRGLNGSSSFASP
jgi:FkbM family methyltransferase